MTATIIQHPAMALYVADDGTTRDRHIEVLFRDLYHGTIPPDESISLHNFNLYMEALYNVECDLETFHDEDTLTDIIEHVFGEHDYCREKDGKYRVELRSWQGKHFVQNAEKPIALALGIALQLRLRIAEHFRKTSVH
jgi:hypothetical protein